MDPRFSDWLRDVVPTELTWRTKLSECRRLEKAYGDLDALYDKDEMEGLIGELTYTAVNERDDIPNPSKLEINGDLRNNLASYLSAARKYHRFRSSIELNEPYEQGLGQRHEQDEDDFTSQLTFGLEKDMQAALRANIAQLEPGLEIVDGGAERRVASGFIDILARDAARTYVVIELKAVKAPLKAQAQIASYMGDILDETGEMPRGILVAPDFDIKLISAARVMPGLSLTRYHYSFRLEQVG